MSGGCRDLRLARNHEALRDERADDARLTRAWNVDPFERRVVPDVVGRVAVRDLPDDLAFVEADGADAAVRRLCNRQALHIEPTAAFTTAATATSGCTAAAAAGRRIRAALGSVCAS